MDINRDNYQQYLLRAVDEELSEEEHTALMRFLQTYPAGRQELAVLQDTKLPTEEIPFPDKASLYRHSVATGNRRFMHRRTYRWIALAAACAAGWLMVVYLGGSPSPSAPPPTAAVQAGGPAVPKSPSEKEPRAERRPVAGPLANQPASRAVRKPIPQPVPEEPKTPEPERLPRLALQELSPLSRLPAPAAMQTEAPSVATAVPPVVGKGPSPQTREGGLAGVAETLAAAKNGLDETITEKVSTAHRSTRDLVDHLAQKGITIGNLTIALKD